MKVIGRAGNCKISACIICDEQEVYYVLEYDYWPDTLWNQKITLLADYYIEKEKKEVVNGFTKPYIPKKKILKNVKILKIEESESF